MSANLDMVPQSGIGKAEPRNPVIHHNPWLEPKGEPLAKLAADIVEIVEAATVATSPRKPREDAVGRRRAAIGNIVASLAEIALWDGPESAIAISAKNDAKSRYDCRDVHGGILLQAIAEMEREGLVEVTPGKFHSLRTTIRPSGEFLKRLAASGAQLSDLGMRPGREALVLKANSGPRGRKVLVDYAETPETIKLREEVRKITAMVNLADLRLMGVQMPPVFLQRIFQIDGNDSLQTFNRHGRLWGGWWQNLKRDRRSLITIDGEPLCDLDFKACFLNLSYARMGAVFPEDDPYEIDGLDACYRPALKKAFSALLFRNGEKRPRLPEEIRRELPGEWTMPRLIEAFSQRHPIIAPLFGSGVGLEIMHTESEILVAALLDLANHGITALGMHDGLALAIEKREAGIMAMKEASRRIVGVELPVVEKPV